MPLSSVESSATIGNPEVLRFGLTPLYLGFTDVWDTVEALREILDNRLWDAPAHKVRGAVT